MLESHIHEMALALQQEAEAAKRQGATRTSILRNGRLQGSKPQGYLYLFDIERRLPSAIGNDFPGEIEVHGRTFSATIAESRDAEILVLLPQSFGLSISVAYLHTDLTYLLTLLADRLPLILGNSYYSENAAKVLNQAAARISDGSILDAAEHDKPRNISELVETLRPRKKLKKKSGKEIREYYQKMLRKLRWVIASDKRIPQFAVLYRATIDSLLNDPPRTKQELLVLSEFQRNPTNISGYEDVVLAIVRELQATLAD